MSKALLPCLIFSSILKAFRISDFDLWLPVVIFVSGKDFLLLRRATQKMIVCRLLGILFGYLIGAALGLPESARKFAMCVTGFSHTTSIQLLLVAALAEILDSLKMIYNKPNVEVSLTAYERGVYYVVLSEAVAVLWNWTLGYE